MSPRRIVLATGNPGKLREMAQVLESLPVEVVSISEIADLPEPDETGTTFAQNAREKAIYYASATQEWCLADDSGLQVDALDGAPGIRSARYSSDTVAPGADRRTVDRANNAKLLAALQDVPDVERTARFVCCVALAGPDGVLIEASGQFEGVIARTPAGNNGFGYDPLFYVPAEGAAAAELPAEKKNSISHRGRAVRRFSELLAGYLSDETSGLK